MQHASRGGGGGGRAGAGGGAARAGRGGGAPPAAPARAPPRPPRPPAPRAPPRAPPPGLRSVEHVGGLDNWLVKTSDDDLSLRARRLKRDVKKKLSTATAA